MDGSSEAQMVVAYRGDSNYYYAGLSASSSNGRLCIGRNIEGEDQELTCTTQTIDPQFSLVTGGAERIYHSRVWVKFEQRDVEDPYYGWITYFDLYVSLTVQYDDGGTLREGYLYASDCFSRDWPGVPLGIGVRAGLTAVSFTDRHIETPHLLILSGEPDSGLPPDQDTYNAIGQGVYVVGQTVNYSIVNLSPGISFTPISWSGATAWSDPQ